MAKVKGAGGFTQHIGNFAFEDFVAAGLRKKACFGCLAFIKLFNAPDSSAQLLGAGDDVFDSPFFHGGSVHAVQGNTD